MKSCKRPQLMKNQARDYYQTPTDCSKEEIQKSCDFMRKVKELENKTIFDKLIYVMKSYQSKSITYIDLKTKVAYLLCNHDELLEEFHQLLSDLATEEEKNRNPKKKSDVERTVEFLNKLEALGNGLHGNFLSACTFCGDMKTLIKQVNVILRDHAALKEEFRVLLIDSRLLTNEWKFVSPSYKIRLEEEEEEEDESLFSNEILNERYVSTSEYDPSKVKKKIMSLEEVKLSNIEDKLFDKDRYLHALESVVEFGYDNEHPERKPPVRFNVVVGRFYDDLGKKVPREFTTDPKRALQGILSRLESTRKKVREAKDLRVRKFYDRHQLK